ncbi:MAG: peptide ABC transporter substrate-binding protein [Actinomycetota bacterium]
MPASGGSLRRTGLVAVLVVILGACTGDPDPAVGPVATAGGATPGAETTAPTGGSPTPTESPNFEPDAVVLDVAVTEPSTLDPMRIQDPASVLVARQLYEGLTAWDPDAEEVIPAAAESWEVSNGGRTFTFELRSGMTFHDGRSVRAEDFLFAFNRIAKKKSGSELAYTLDRVEGFEEVNQFGDSNKLSGLRAPNDTTLKITLSEPFREFPAVLTHPGLVPLRKDSVEDTETFLSEPAGNGAFQIVEPWTPGESVTMKSFDDFFVSQDLDGIRFNPFPDAAASWLQFVAGDFDVAEVPAGQIEAAAEAFGDRGYKPFLAGYYYGLNVKSKALRKRRGREAISRAIDREYIATNIYKETMAAPRGIVPRGMPGFEDDICARLCEHSPAAARSMVRRLPAKRREVRLEYTVGPPHTQVARAVKQDLEDVGFNVKVKGYAFDRYLRRLRAGDQEMYRLGWIAEYPVADVFLSSLFAADSPDNHSGFSSKKVDKLLSKAHKESSEAARVELYRRAERKILAKVPIVPIGDFVTHWAAQENVENIQFDVMGGFDAVTVRLLEE